MRNHELLAAGATIAIVLLAGIVTEGMDFVGVGFALAIGFLAAASALWWIRQLQEVSAIVRAKLTLAFAVWVTLLAGSFTATGHGNPLLVLAGAGCVCLALSWYRRAVAEAAVERVPSPAPVEPPAAPAVFPGRSRQPLTTRARTPAAR